MDFKKVIRINLLVLLILTTIVQAQSNLVFEQALYIPLGPDCVVPSGKIWKIESTSAGELFIDNNSWIVRNNDGTGGMPIWLPEGKTISSGGNHYISVLQFSLVPISSSNNTAVANSFGNVIPSDDPNSSIPTIFESPKVFTSGGIWIVPPGVTNILVEVWGQGGKGGDATATVNSDYYNYYGFGGGGGAYGYESIEVTPGTYYTVVVGPSGTGLKQNDEYLIFAEAGSDGANNGEYVPGWSEDCELYSTPGGSSTAEFNISGQKSNCMHGGAGANGGRGGNFSNTSQLEGVFPGGGGAGGYAYENNRQYGRSGGGGQLIIYF